MCINVVRWFLCPKYGDPRAGTITKPRSEGRTCISPNTTSSLVFISYYLPILNSHGNCFSLTHFVLHPEHTAFICSPDIPFRGQIEAVADYINKSTTSMDFEHCTTFFVKLSSMAWSSKVTARRHTFGLNRCRKQVAAASGSRQVTPWKFELNVDRYRTQPTGKLVPDQYKPQYKFHRASDAQTTATQAVVRDGFWLAEDTKRIAEHELKFRPLVSRGIDYADFSIITPYTANITKMQALLASDPDTALHSIPVKTVDSFQGREGQVIVLVLCVTRDTGPAFVANPNRYAKKNARVGDIEVGHEDNGGDGNTWGNPGDLNAGGW
ncbi:hypothetical protein G7046_g1716 [Stylonectria norvegica]|nr:hypothetical protein G7046_g1716 [Stylonectria norvegica]